MIRGLETSLRGAGGDAAIQPVDMAHCWAGLPRYARNDGIGRRFLLIALLFLAGLSAPAHATATIERYVCLRAGNGYEFWLIKTKPWIPVYCSIKNMGAPPDNLLKAPLDERPADECRKDMEKLQSEHYVCTQKKDASEFPPPAAPRPMTPPHCTEPKDCQSYCKENIKGTECIGSAFWCDDNRCKCAPSCL